MLLAGALGNGMNALWYRTGHLSIGASTAVFGAVGILAATQLTLDKTAGPRPWLERAAPVVGGLALLGMLGASPHSDLLAHLFGLFAGILGGARRRALDAPIATELACCADRLCVAHAGDRPWFVGIGVSRADLRPRPLYEATIVVGGIELVRPLSSVDTTAPFDSNIKTRFRPPRLAS